MSQTKEQYLDRIREILDEASGDESLTPLDYQALCQDVAEDCNDRADAIDTDLEEDEE